jgi:hypothetical protein
MRRQAAQGREEGRGRWSGAGARERRSTNAVRRARRLAAESGLRALMANLAGDGIGTAFASCGWGEGVYAVRWEVGTALGRWRAADCVPAPAEREVGWLLLAREPRQTVEQAAWVSMGSLVVRSTVGFGRVCGTKVLMVGYNLQHTPRHSVLGSIPRFFFGRNSVL